ncbi:MAG TPA: hypothetical protein VH592_15155 [Gemmataceae bacterium]|jgi:hypothetical protein
MKSNEIAYPKWASWAGSIALAIAGAAGVALWKTQGASLPLRSVVGLALLTAGLSAVKGYRIRASRRLSAALDAYAERELDRVKHRRLTSPSRNKQVLSRGSV